MTLNDQQVPPPAEEPAEPPTGEGPATDDEGQDPLEGDPVPLPGPVRHPSTFGGLFYLGVLAATVTGVVIVLVLDDWRLGVRVVAGSLAAAALLRLVLPQKDAGMLAVRHRLVDVCLLAAVSAALFFLATSIPDQPVAP